MKTNVKEITQGGMMVAILSVLLLLNRQTADFLMSTIYWILSFPIMIYHIKSSGKLSGAVFVSSMLLSMLISTPQTTFYLFSALLVGVVYGEGVKRKWENKKLLGSTIILTFFSYLITMFVLASAFGYNIIEARQELIEMIRPYAAMISADLAQLVQVLDIATTLLLVVLQSLCTHMIAILLFKKLRIETNPLPLFNDIKLPRWVGVVSLIAWFAYMSLSYVDYGEKLSFIILFSFVCTAMVCLGYGFFIILILGKKRKWLFLLFIPFLWNIVLILSIADSLTKGAIKSEGAYGSFRKL